MKVQIDQSGKIEYTSQDTVIAFSNGKRKAIKIGAKDKRELQAIFRKMGKGQLFVIRCFSLLIALLIYDEDITEIEIDTEYPGWEAQIKNFLIQDLKRKNMNLSPHMISFSLIGKSVECHWHAYYVFKKKRNPEKIVKTKDLLNELFNA